MSHRPPSSGLDAKKVWPAVSVVVLGGVHVFLLMRGHKPPAALDQAIIGALGTLFAARGKKDSGDKAEA